MPKPKKGSYRTTEELEPLRAASANINDASGADGGAWWHEAPPSGTGAVGKKAPVSALAYVSSSSTKGDLDYADEGRYSANVPPRTACDLVSFILFILFTACALIAGGISLGAGAYWLHAVLDNKPLADCFILLLSAALPLGLGGFIILLLVGITFVSTCFCVMPHSALSSVKGCCAKAVRIVFLHVIPFVCLILGVGGSIAALYFSTMARSQPDLNRNFDRVAGLDGPVTISRDSNGLVHISANSRRDALFGQGVAHGQDRLWQVEFQRLVGRGRLSEFVGSAGKKMDKQIRTLNFPAGARRMCENASPANRALVQRYIDGLNFYVSQYSERPAEFLIMGRKLLHIHQPEPFEAMDSCLIAMLLMWQMGANIPTEVQRFKIFWHTDRTFDEVNELFINHTNISSTILSSAQMVLTEADAVAARAREADDEAVERHLYDTHMAALRDQHNPNGRYSKDGRSSGRPDDNEDDDDDEVSAAARRSMTAQDILSREAAADADADAGAGCLSAKQQKAPAAVNPKEAPFFTFADFVQNSLDLLDITAPQASNAWAARAPIVAGDAAADGSHPTIGASDPHLGINVPSVWHWTRLTFPTESGEMYDAAGVGLPGLPGVHIGKTTNTSWGITMSMTDLGDLFLITPDPARPSTHYMANGASEPFTFRRESIRVKGSSDTVELSIAETVYGPIATEALGLPHPLLFAVRTDFLRDDTTSLDGLLCLNEPTTQTAKDVRDRCLSRIRSPGFSIPIEDRHGGFAYSLTGAHPKRARGHTGRFPTLGNGSFDYQGFIPHAELPTLAVSRAESNAKGGFIAAANQKTYPDGYKHSLGYDFVYPYRGARIQQALRDPAAYLAEAERTKARAAALASGEGGNTDDSANNNNRLAAIDPATALSNVDFHLTVQRDVRSNQAHDWFSNILNVSAYNNNDGGMMSTLLLFQLPLPPRVPPRVFCGSTRCLPRRRQRARPGARPRRFLIS